MEGSLQNRAGSQPSCSYDAACRQHLRQPQSCRDTRQQLAGCSHVQVQCLHRRQDRRMRSWCSSSIVLVVLAATLLQPSHAFVLSGDEQDRAFEDMSMLARAGKLLTVAVSDAASAIGATKRKSTHVEKRTMLMPDRKVRTCKFTKRLTPTKLLLQTGTKCHALHQTLARLCQSRRIQDCTFHQTAAHHLADLAAAYRCCCFLQQMPKKGHGHGGIPGWFKGVVEGNAQPAAVLESNRRMLRRQKQHHHSVEDEWLKVCFSPTLLKDCRSQVCMQLAGGHTMAVSACVPVMLYRLCFLGAVNCLWQFQPCLTKSASCGLQICKRPVACIVDPFSFNAKSKRSVFLSATIIRGFATARSYRADKK